MVVPLVLKDRLLGGLGILWNRSQLRGSPPNEGAKNRRRLSA